MAKQNPKYGNRPRGHARPDAAKPRSRPKLRAQNRLVAKRSGAPKRSEGGLDSVGFRTSKKPDFRATILFAGLMARYLWDLEDEAAVATLLDRYVWLRSAPVKSR